jgi:hypothetical protein
MGKLHQEDVRRKIQTTKLLKVLENHALGEFEELALTRIKAIEILLRKSMPDLSAITLDGDVGVTINWPVAPPPIGRKR